MKAKELFNYEGDFAVLREPSRNVIAAYQNANRFFDTIQEYVYIEQGMPNLAKAIHEQAHKFPQIFDRFADMLHERHLMAEYPATAEMDWKATLKSIDDVFETIISVFEDIQDALEKFHVLTDNGKLRPMALFSEELMSANSKDYTKFIQAWMRWNEDGGSKTSFDSWCRELFEVN